MLTKTYDPRLTEDEIYSFWEENNYFKANANSAKVPYVIVMPPPNITGNLHMGHALDNTLQDVLIRYKRMCSFETLWLPGTDHASIATEAKITEQIRKEKNTKENLGRENFMKRAYEWKEKYGKNICRQIKKMGSSCDWSRERFTMDEKYSKSVIEFFVRLYRKGLIYRGERIVNWCVNCRTSISDAEVEFCESAGKLWHIKYYLKNSNEFITVATTRPETIFGDTAIAVNPSDERHVSLLGKIAVVPVCGREIPVISDDYVTKNFGTGALKVTPAHDINDFEIGRRHNLKIISVIDKKGFLNENCCIFKNMERFEARKSVAEYLNSKNFIAKEEEINHNVGKCYRCGHVIEPMLSMQWFVKMESLVVPATKIVNSGSVKFVPKKFEKVHLRWMENIKDWCISRRLWWGHRIPAWHCSNCGGITVSRGSPARCEKCGSENINQDEDSLDTWFSSALWPFSALGWPEKTKDLDFFYPTDTLVTGYDIIFFWISRMIFSALELTGKQPFEQVLIHGLVRDSQGRKMSKSLGNGIDPLDIIEKFGADALRFALINGITPGNDMRFSYEKLEGSRNFINKLWNAARFLQMNCDFKIFTKEEIILILRKMPSHHAWILSRINKTVTEVHKSIKDFELGIALKKIYDLFWDEFCDWYLEIIKLDFKNDEIRENTAKCSVFAMSLFLKLLHPFIPFVTEKIQQTFKFNDFKEALIIQNYPIFDLNLDNKKSEFEINFIISIIKAIRAKKSEIKILSNKRINVFIESRHKDLIKKNAEIIKTLALVKEIDFKLSLENCELIITDLFKIYIPVSELADKENLKKHLMSELSKLEKQIKKNENLLKNSEFMSKAPKSIIKKTQEKINNLIIKTETIKSKLCI